MSIERTKEKQQEGVDAFHRGDSDDDNPYEIGSDDAMDWNDGYNQAAEEVDGYDEDE